MTGIALTCQNLRFAWPGAEFAFDLAVPAGEIVAVMGPSGSGKSTLLSLVAGFEEPVSGTVLMDGKDVTSLPPAARPVSMIFQENNLFGHLDAAANIGLGRSPSLRLTAADRKDISGALARVGLAGMEKRLPRELSGGERQRVALARVLVRDRPLLLLDEPFASLGPALRQEMLDLLRELHREHGMTILMATHHPDDARAISGQLAFVENGRISAYGPTAGFFAPYGPEAFRRYIGERG